MNLILHEYYSTGILIWDPSNLALSRAQETRDVQSYQVVQEHTSFEDNDELERRLDVRRERTGKQFCCCDPNRREGTTEDEGFNLVIEV